MKITDVEVLILRSDNLDENIADGSQEACIIRVHTDEGITGLGEVDCVPTIVKAIVEAPSSHSVSHGLRKLVVGEDPFEVEKIWEKMYQGTMYHGRRAAVIHAMSGIDMALWDIMGKAVNKPVYKLLGGGFRKSIRAYASLLMPETVAEVKSLTTAYVEQGYTAVKLGWGPLGQDEKNDVRLVAAARQAIGDNVDLMIDAGLCYNVNSAIRIGKKFEEFNLFWFEEPCWADNFDHYARISEAVNIPIAAGEQETTRYSFKELIERGRIDIVQPDISRCGGITEAKKIAMIAQMNNIPLVPHVFSTGILTAASLHVVASIPNAMIIEFCRSESPLNRNLLTKPFDIRDGYLDIPEAPGLGVELNEDVVQKYLVK